MVKRSRNFVGGFGPHGGLLVNAQTIKPRAV